MAKANSKKNKVDVKKLASDLSLAFNSVELTQLYRLYVGGRPPTRKVELAAEVAFALEPDVLEEVYNQLTELERSAVAEALYSSDGYSPEKFAAKYGKDISFANSEPKAPSMMRLFLRYEIFRDYRVRPALEACLKSFVAMPASAKLKTVKALPTNVIGIGRAELAQIELGNVLKAVQDGKVLVSEKTGMPSTDTMYKLSHIIDGDFYQELDDTEFEFIGPIRSFAWPVLLRAARLVERQGKKLVLDASSNGIKFDDTCEVLKTIWKEWLEYDFDELSRVQSVKGQNRKGRYSMSTPRRRRLAIVDTLGDCPTNEWIEINEFMRFSKASGRTFSVSYQPWTLQIVDSVYGGIGGYGTEVDQVLQEIYAKTFLLEYAATLGLIDVALVHPRETQSTYEKILGAGFGQFMSRYDGLVYFRLNELGAYCLDKTATYQPSVQRVPKLSVRPSLRIALVDGVLSVSDRLILDAFAEYIADGVWDLSREKSIAACEDGREIESLRALLTRLDDQELPDQVTSYINQVSKRAGALKAEGDALVFSCETAEIASEICEHALMKNLCRLLGDKDIVVMRSKEEKFRKNLRIIGYGRKA